MDEAAADRACPCSGPRTPALLTDLSYIQFMGPRGRRLPGCAASPCATRTQRWRSWTRATSRAWSRLLDAALDRITPDLELRPGRHEPHPRRRHRHLRVEGRPRRRRGQRGRHGAPAAPDARAAAGLGRAPAPRRTGGATSSPSPASCWRTPAWIRARSTPSPRAPSAPACCPWTRAGEPLMNGVLYGVDTRASAQIAALNEPDRRGRPSSRRCGNALTSQSVGPKILWLKETHPDLYARTAKVLTSTSYLTWKLTGEYVIDHYTAANFSPLYDVNRAGLDRGPGARHPAARPAAPAAVVDRHRRARDRGRRGGDRPGRGHARSPSAPSTRRPRRSASGSRPRAR